MSNCPEDWGNCYIESPPEGSAHGDGGDVTTVKINHYIPSLRDR